MAAYLFAVCGLAILVAVYPVRVLAFAVAYAVLAGIVLLLGRAWRLELWQMLAVAALTGYVVLNYGFANLAFHVGEFPLIVGHVLMFTALWVALVSNPTRLVLALREPAMLCLSALLLISSIHLILDIPRYSLYAVRDSSLFLEGVFLVLGLAWAKKETDLVPLMKFLFAMFLVNLVYSFSFPWAEALSSWSPKSGIFLVVPVFGCYSQNYLYLLAGALFCLWVGQYFVATPRWILLVLAMVQLLGLAIHQARSSYVGIVVVLIVLIALAEFRRWARLIFTLSLGTVTFLLLTSVEGFRMPGRVGPVTGDFLREHAQSLLLQAGTPSLGTIHARFEWHKEAWERANASRTTLMVGEGFGRPLISFYDQKRGVAVRQPHNTHLTVLARLGLVGLAFWTLFHLSIIARFLRTLLLRPRLEPKMRALILWLFVYYVLAMIVTTVQPHLEFSYGAIPFYFLVGVALRITDAVRVREPLQVGYSGGRLIVRRLESPAAQ